MDQSLLFGCLGVLITTFGFIVRLSMVVGQSKQAQDRLVTDVGELSDKVDGILPKVVRNEERVKTLEARVDRMGGSRRTMRAVTPSRPKLSIDEEEDET
jgi:uncharacterized protein YlxW (UPF0749 family)